MATAMTFNSLVEEVRGYIERGGAVDDTVVSDQIPVQINETERDLANKLKILGFITPLTSVMVAGQSVYAKPDRWRKTTSFSIRRGSGLDEYKALYTRTLEFCRVYWPNPATEAEPIYYADYDYQNWLVAPTPDAAYPIETLVYMLPALLDVANQTNWTTEYASDALRYGTLQRIAPFVRNQADLQQYSGMYQEAVSTLNGQDIQRVMDRTSQRSGV